MSPRPQPGSRGVITEVPLTPRATALTNGPTNVAPSGPVATLVGLTEDCIGRATLAGRVTEYTIPL